MAPQKFTLASTVAPDDAGTRKATEENRPHQVQAAIVRTMKARRTMMHHDLVAEVPRLLGKLFDPDVRMIKKQIEALLEADYIARDAVEAHKYIYLA